MDLLLTGIFLFFVFLIGLLPFPLLYLFANFGQFFLHRIMGYRKKVILSNLKGCFPNLPENELNHIVGNVYKNLSDIIAEGIKGFSMLPSTVKKRHFITNPEIIEPWLAQGKSVIALPAHFNNFEWGSMSPGLFTKHPIIAFYKPLSNKFINSFMKWSRAKFGTTLASIYETFLIFERNAQTPSVYIMAADQSPAKAEKSYWITFLGKETAFLHGPEKYARMYNYPVVYVDVQRVKRGYYTLEVILLADDPATLPEGEVTKRYAEKLEQAILKSPGNWLWSHKRWKLAL
ncbi:MAG: lysophospholipid acyltransferase family protein [Bacteroidetes bacterium]|nr:lysophospholipid acyltransferase family protein [Bacteroidota bacterium]